MSEVAWLIGRVKLYELWRENPQQKQSDLAEAVGYSVNWVQKWLKQFRQKKPEENDISFFLSQSRARHTSNKQVTKEVEEAILEMRDNPPENLQRTPGPKTILYYLGKRQDLEEAGH